MSKRNELRSHIDDLINDDIPDEVPGIENESIEDVAKKSTDYMDYEVEKRSTLGKAKRIMDGLLKFYLSEEIIEEHEYIKARMEIDKMALSSLIFQMQTAERAIITMLRNIDDGEMHPRMFEVLGGLQKTLLDIIKSQTMYMMAAEENMKKLSRDIDVYNPGSSKSLPQNSQKKESSMISVRGTKELMRSIQAEQHPIDTIDPIDEIKDEEPPEVTDLDFEENE
jgi:hypothetical protein